MTNKEAIILLSQIMDAILASNSWLPSTDNPIKESFGMAINALTTQAEERTEERTETHGVCLDTIDRQAALDWLKNEWNGMVTSLFDGIKALPSAQPEVLACGEGELSAQPEDICSECDAWNVYKNYAQPQRKTGRWIDHAEEGYVECPFCQSATNCDGNISDLHFCFSCGARMEDSEE